MTGPTIGSLFSGYGGLEMAVQRSRLGGRVLWHSEVDDAPSKILAHHWPGVPNLGDITAVDWAAVPRVDIVAGGFPCTDLSSSGAKKGLRPGTKSGLWAHMRYGIEILRPRVVVAENVRGLLHSGAHSDVEPCPWCVGDGSGDVLRALGAVLGDLADLGYDAAWCGLPADDVGCCHGRFRVALVAADADGEGLRWLAEHDRVPRPARAAGEHGDDADGLAVDHHRTLERYRYTDALTPFIPAIRRWERTVGRPAPAPERDPGKHGQPRVSPAFSEWLMGLPAGHVTAVPGLTASSQLKALGNGVVPQQLAVGIDRCIDMLTTSYNHLSEAV